MPVPVQRTNVVAAYLECADVRIDGLLMFDSPACAAFSGTLCAGGGTGDIGLVEFPSNAASIKGQPLEQLRRSTNHAALVVATRVTDDSLAPINAQFYNTPFGPPVLQVAGMHYAWLMEQAGKGAAAHFVSRYTRQTVDSFNVDARVTCGASSPPIVVVTPRTSWWESTAERAGGIVAWLAAVHAAAELTCDTRLKRDVLAWATCGHELGHLGLQELTRLHMPIVWAPTSAPPAS